MGKVVERMLKLKSTRGSAMFMVLAIIMLLMTISVCVITIQASDNRIIDLYGKRISNVYGVLTLNRSIPDTGLVGHGYTAHFSAQGGDGNYTYSIVAGTLPSGLTLIDTGYISGTPTTADIWVFTVRVTDGTGRYCEREYQITITSDEETFSEYLLTNNLYVFGNEVKITGSSTISGEEATVVVREDFDPGSASLCYISTKNIYIEVKEDETGKKVLKMANFELGIPGGRSSVYVDGSVEFSGGSASHPRIHGDLYYTGTLTFVGWGMNESLIRYTVNHVDSIPFPNFPIPPLKPDQWYEEQGYTSDPTPDDNMKFIGDSYTFPTSGEYNNVTVVAKTGDITLSGDVHCTGAGILFAPNGKVIVEGSSTFTGIIVSKRVEVTGHSHVTFKQPTMSAEDLPF